MVCQTWRCQPPPFLPQWPSLLRPPFPLDAQSLALPKWCPPHMILVHEATAIILPRQAHCRPVHACRWCHMPSQLWCHPAIIQAAGRWASNTFQIYIRKNPILLQALLHPDSDSWLVSMHLWWHLCICLLFHLMDSFSVNCFSWMDCFSHMDSLSTHSPFSLRIFSLLFSFLKHFQSNPLPPPSHPTFPPL